MFANLLVLLLVIGLVVLFGWFTVRAVRAKKPWVKVVGGLAAGLMTLLLTAVALFGAKGMMDTYFPGAPPAPELTVAGTAEQIARGEYLVNMSCINCHSAVGADGNPTGEHPMSGGWNIAEAEGFGFIGAMVAENLTPGGKLAGYSDGELFRVLRYSIDQEGHGLGFMSFMPYRELSDADTEAIIAYLRSLPPASNDGFIGDKMSFLGAVMSGAGMFGEPPPDPPAAITAPPAGVTAAYGQYVATFGECRGCHGPDMTGTPATSVSAAIPNPRPFVSTLTQGQFFEMMRGGIKPNGQPFPETMPWQNAARMTDDDLAALYAYLTAPVK
ncbi:MAG TPA: c-type cytochrome [Chloroflexota bacterium]|nr:c-type cytochrome [Chloroflexota bacterium]